MNLFLLTLTTSLKIWKTASSSKETGQKSNHFKGGVQLFEYCKRSKASIGTTLGEFLSHKVKWTHPSGRLYSPYTINNWDRKKIANRYVDEYFCTGRYGHTYDDIGGKGNREKFVSELAIKIDEFIPRRYFVKYHLSTNKYGTMDGTYISSMFKGKDAHSETKDLIYVYNHERDTDVTTSNYTNKEFPVSEKQLSYLNYLADEAGFFVKNFQNLNSQTASELIGFLLGQREQPQNIFDFLEYT